MIKKFIRKLINLYNAIMIVTLSKFKNKKYVANFRYKINNKRKIEFDNPKRFNDKLQWLKFNWYDEKAIMCADKLLVRDYIIEKKLEHILIPLYGVYNTVEEIDIDTIPYQSIIKNTKDSGGVVKVFDDKANLKEKLLKTLKNKGRNYYELNGEWIYKGINKIVVEKNLQKKDEPSLIDYKFFCFNGEPRFLFTATDRSVNTKFTFFDLNWNRIPVKNHYPIDTREISKPSNLNEMIEICKILSKDFPHVRVDLYSVEGKTYFGELTFFHFSGEEPFEPDHYDYEFGNFLDLSSIKDKKYIVK